MSFDAYVGIMATDFLGIIGSIVLAIVQTKRNKEGNRQIRVFKVLIAVLIVLEMIFTGAYFFSSRQQKMDDFNHQMDEAYFDLENEDFLAAAEHCNQAYLISYNTESQLEAIYSKAMCYFLYGMSNSRSDYYQKASKIYKTIIESEEYINSEHYVDAVIDMAQIYYALDYQWDEPEWYKLIAWLENQVAQKSAEEIVSFGELSLRLKAVYTLGLYYECAAYSSVENLMDTELASKTLKYYEKFAYLYELNVEVKGETAVPSFYTSNVLNIADFLFVYAISSPDPVGYINQAIELCNVEIESLNTSSASIAEYIELKKNVGKGLIFLGTILEDEAASYRKEAYKTLSPLLSIDDEKAQFPLMNLGYYLIRTNLCSNEEVDRIVDIYEYNISQIPFSSNAYGRIDTLLSACTSCRWIVENYDFSDRALADGILYSQELMGQVYDFLTEEQRVAAEEFYSFFADAEKKNDADGGVSSAIVDVAPESGASEDDIEEGLELGNNMTEVQVPSGYQIMVSASRVELYQEFTVTVIPAESEFTNIVIHAKDPLGEVWTFPLSAATTKRLYIDRLDLIGTWTIYADVSNAQGTYRGEGNGPFVQLTVEKGLLGDLFGF